MNIGLLGCDDVPERFRHLGGTYRDMFEALLTPHAPHTRFTWYPVYEGELPASIDACDAYICTGSRYSVYEDRDWIHALGDCVRRLHEAGKPYVGICFGHQMLAHALGGEVRRAEQGWGVGLHKMRITTLESWMQPEQSECKLQYMHADQVQRMPAGGALLGSARHCPIAMFRVGTMLGIEGHPEFPAAYIEALLLDRKSRIGPERVAPALASLSERTDEALVAGWIANFLAEAPSVR